MNVIEPFVELIETIFFCRLARTLLDERLRDEQRAADVDGHDRVEQLVVELAEALRGVFAAARFVAAGGAIAVDAGVVDQHVDRLAVELGRQRAHLVDAGDVHALDAHVRMLGDDGCQRFGHAVAAVRRDHRPAFRRVLLDELEAEPEFAPVISTVSAAAADGTASA